MKFLNTREIKKIYKALEEQFGNQKKLDFAFAENNKDKIFLISKTYADIDENTLRINNFGLYFAKRQIDGIRLSIEGSQLIEPTKNIIQLNQEQMELWLKGEDFPFEHETSYVIVRYKDDTLGCGRVVKNELRNMVAKERRLKSLQSSN
jgi:NOL1/NOP2/fmu family ribosome biogenesis protein